jgi:hypothetical protein
MSKDSVPTNHRFLRCSFDISGFIFFNEDQSFVLERLVIVMDYVFVLYEESETALEVHVNLEVKDGH